MQHNFSENSTTATDVLEMEVHSNKHKKYSKNLASDSLVCPTSTQATPQKIVITQNVSYKSILKAYIFIFYMFPVTCWIILSHLGEIWKNKIKRWLISENVGTVT